MKRVIPIFYFLILTFSLQAQGYKTQVENNNKFSFELFSKVSNLNENLFISPFSVSSALAMTYEGAKGKTRKEMAKTLHFPEKNELVNKNFQQLLKEVQSDRSKHYTLSLTNSLWAQKGYEFLHSFFTSVEKYFFAQLNEVDFKNEAEREQARKKINAYVAKKTNNKIKELIEKRTLDRESKLVLINTVYFLSEWDKAFNAKATKSKDFFGISGSEKKDFMHKASYMKYAKSENFEMLEIPYKDKRASMFVLLPNKGIDFAKWQASLNYEVFASAYKKAEARKVKLRLPKFKTEYKNDLAKVLAASGMKQAFSGRADFRGMTCKRELSIDKVIHQTFINVDEAGTEAAAATAVTMRKTSSHNPNTIVFDANRPFVYLIKENKTGSILFMGQLIK